MQPITPQDIKDALNVLTFGIIPVVIIFTHCLGVILRAAAA